MVTDIDKKHDADRGWNDVADAQGEIQGEQEIYINLYMRAKERLFQFLNETDKPLSEWDESVTTHDLIDITALILSDRESDKIRGNILRNPERLDVILNSEQNLRRLCFKLYDGRTENFWKFESSENTCDGWSIGFFIGLIRALENNKELATSELVVRSVMNEICEKEEKDDPSQFHKAMKELLSNFESDQADFISRDYFDRIEFENQIESDFLEFIRTTDKSILEFKYNMEVKKAIESVEDLRLRRLQNKQFMDSIISSTVSRVCSCQNSTVRNEFIRNPQRFDPIFSSYENIVKFCKNVYHDRRKAFWLRELPSDLQYGWTVNHFDALSESLQLCSEKQYNDAAEIISTFVKVAFEEEEKVKRSQKQLADIKIQRMLSDEQITLERIHENSKYKSLFLKELCINGDSGELCLLEKISDYDKRLAVVEKAIKLPSKRARETQIFIKQRVDPESPYLAEELLAIL